MLFSCQEADKQVKATQKNDNAMTQKNNPLLQDWQTPFGTAPLDKIKSEDYLPAYKTALELHNQEIERIVNNPDAPTFKNTVVALEQSGQLLKRVNYLFDAIENANTDEVLKETSKKIKPLLAAHFDKITMNKDLFKRIEQVHNTFKTGIHQDAKLLDNTYKSFVRSGVNLPEDNQEKLQAINKELASLSQQFNDNLLAETNSFELYVTNQKDLGNMPKAVLDAAQEEAKKHGHKSGWSFTLQRPSIYPFLDYAVNRDLRKKIFQAYAHRGNNDNANDNKKVLEKIIQLRAAKAKLLKFDTYADYVLDEQMAKTPQKVFDLLDKIWQPAIATAKRDRDMMAKMMQSENIKGKFRASDWRYYVRKIRSKNYNFDENETRPYFEVNAVRNGAFLLANKLFGLNFKENKNINTWHKDQQAFEVTDNNGKHIGVIYMDFFTRASKRGGAWMNELRMQSNVNGQFITPIVTTNFNFPPPTKDAPALLNFDQAQTVFHEFGHALHGLLSNVKYASMSGTNVPRDFVEFPSQVMENWMSTPELLKLYAKHYKTGKVIPTELVAKMNNANNFDVGFRTVEYMAAAYLDMHWHTLSKNTDQDTEKFEKQTMQKIGLINEIIPRYRSTYYAHIFGGGYGAGYYSYLWSEVLDADAFAAFKETGDIFNQELAKKYKIMISSGGTKDGMELYKAFRGREPKIDALLQRKGF